MALLNLKNFRFLLVTCLAFGLLALGPNLAHGAQWAIVKAQKAIVYADAQMSAPIGYLRKGKKIRVGEVEKNKGRVLPTVYLGKLVYLRRADLETAQDLALIESATERVAELDKKGKRESRVGVALSGFSASSDSFNSVKGSDDDSNSLFITGAGLYGFTKEGAEKRALKLKLEYFSASREEVGLSYALISTGAAYELIGSEYFSLFAQGAIALSPYAQYEVDSLFKVNGYGAGFDGGLEAIFRFGGPLALHLEAKYQYLKFFGFNLPDSTSEYAIEQEFSPALTGPSLSASLSYAF